MTMVISSIYESSLDGSSERIFIRFLEQAAPLILDSDSLAGENLAAVVGLAKDLGLSHERLCQELWSLERRGNIIRVAWPELNQLANHPDAACAVTQPAGPGECTKQARHCGSLVEQFRQFAQQIVTRRDISLLEIQQQLERQAAKLELSATEVEIVLNTVTLPSIPSDPKSSDAPASSDASAGEQDAAARPAELPIDAFRAWLDPQLTDRQSLPVTLIEEQAWIDHGVQQHGLLSVLAKQAVREAATECGMRLQRDLDGASSHATADITGTVNVPDLDPDDRLEQFLAQVGPVLASEGGISKKCRVVIDAAADRLELMTGELAEALAILQPTPADDFIAEDDPGQEERCESFRRYLRRFIAQLPEPMITFRAERRLVEAGQLFYGVTAKRIKPTINEVAFEMGAQFVSRAQALELVALLMDNLMIQSPEIDSQTRSLVYAEGTCWGLDPIEVETVIRQRLDRAEVMTAAQHRRNRWVLIWVLILTSSVMGLLWWMFVPQA